MPVLYVKMENYTHKKTNKKKSGVRQLNVVIKPSNTRIVLLL